MILDLLNQLGGFLEEVLPTVPLPIPENTTGALAPAQVFLGAIPRDVQDNKAFPCAVVRWAKGEDAEGECSESIDILLGVFSHDGLEAAETWIAVLVSRLRRSLLAKRTLGCWELEFPLESGKAAPEKQQERYHIATIHTRWRRSIPLEPVTEA